MDKSSLFYPDSKKNIYSWLMAFGLTWPVASQNQCLGQSPSSWLPKSEAWAIGHSKPPYGSSLAWLLMPGLGWLLAQSQGREITTHNHSRSIHSSCRLSIQNRLAGLSLCYTRVLSILLCFGWLDRTLLSCYVNWSSH